MLEQFQNYIVLILKQIKQSRNNPTIQNKNKKIDRLNDKKIIEIINILKSKQREQ